MVNGFPIHPEGRCRIHQVEGERYMLQGRPRAHARYLKPQQIERGEILTVDGVLRPSLHTGEGDRR
jgi:hypothetical protein